jgi:signal transduction histidine kinase/PAS domain-containing protein
VRRPKSQPEIKQRDDAGVLRRGPARVITRARDIDREHLELELQNHKLRDTRRALEESRRRYIDLYDFAPVAYLTLDAAGCIREANLTASRLLAVPRLRLSGAAFGQFVAAPDVGKFADHLRRCFEHRIQAVTEVTVSAGRTALPQFMHVTSTPLFDEAENVIECRTTLTDVSAVKRNEDRQSLLSEASRLLATSLDHEVALAGVVRLAVARFADLAFLDLVREDGTLYRVEQAAALDDVVLPNPPFASRPAGAAQLKAIASHQALFLADCAPSRLSEIVGRDVQRIVARDGLPSVMVVPLISRGNVLGVLTVVAARPLRKFSPADLTTAEDLAERIAVRLDNARLYRQARDAIAAREEILALVAHDLRNPLSAIRLSTMSITGAQAPAVERRKSWPRIERVRRIADHMSRMLEDLSEFSGLDARPFSLELAPREVPPMLSEVVDELVPLASDKGINLHLEGPPATGHVVCDPGRVLQVFSNVVGNAVKFSQRGGTIEILSTAQDKEVLFTVRDDGPGMARDDLDHIFDKYWQAEGGMRRGRGLGLYIAKRLVEAQGGAIWCESELEKGTRVSFTLPRPGPGFPLSRPMVSQGVPVSGNPLK